MKMVQDTRPGREEQVEESEGKWGLTLPASSFTPAFIPGVMTPEEDTCSGRPRLVGSSKALSMKM